MSYRQWHFQEFPFVWCVFGGGGGGQYLEKYVRLLVHPSSCDI